MNKDADKTYHNLTACIECYACLDGCPLHKKNDLEKEKLFSYEKIGQYQLIKRVYVKNLLDNHTTDIIFSDMVIDTGMSDKLFNEMSLRRLPLE